MDPLSLTVATLIATKAAEAFSGELGTKSFAALQKVIERVRAKLTGDAAGEEALAALETDPEGAGRVEAVAESLRQSITTDEDFRRELEGLVAELKTDPVAGRFVTTVSGDARVGKIANIGNVTGDVSF